MSTKQSIWLALAGGIVAVSTGCGSGKGGALSSVTAPFKAVGSRVGDASKSVAGRVKGLATKPFQEDDGGAARRHQGPTNLQSRVSTDAHAAAPAGRGYGNAAPAPVDVDWKARRERSSAVDSRRPEANRRQRDPKFNSTFEEELAKLREMEKTYYDRAMEYKAESSEKRELAETSMQKHQDALSRIKRLQTIMDLYESNPDRFDSSQYDSMRFGQKPPPAADPATGKVGEDVKACHVPGWSRDEEYKPPVEGTWASEAAETDAAGGPETDGGPMRLASPPGDAPAGIAAAAAGRARHGNAGRGGGGAEINAPAHAPRISTNILATDGVGAEATVIIGAGSRDGVKKGMLFQFTDAAGRKVVLVVDEVYLTYARAYPHPAHASGDVRISDRVKQIAQLPEPQAAR